VRPEQRLEGEEAPRDALGVVEPVDPDQDPKVLAAPEGFGLL
jgi:hypothetical protein